MTSRGDDPHSEEPDEGQEPEGELHGEEEGAEATDPFAWEPDSDLDPDAEVEIDDVGDEDDDLDAEHALHCPHHGWHPMLLDVVLRLRVLLGDDPDGGTRAALLAAGAHVAEDHLVGPLSGAIEALRAVEARALEAMLPL